MMLNVKAADEPVRRLVEKYGEVRRWPKHERPKLVSNLQLQYISTRFLRYLIVMTEELEQTGAFITCDRITNVDNMFLSHVHTIAREAPAAVNEALRAYPAVLAWLARMPRPYACSFHCCQEKSCGLTLAPPIHTPLPTECRCRAISEECRCKVPRCDCCEIVQFRDSITGEIHSARRHDMRKRGVEWLIGKGMNPAWRPPPVS